ncbi:hypothetical protein IGI04_039261 [Brassica rapa subsp. trilocularis]|uniref:Uncharacterized protein n=1 Tax=Brassica rapa subsp. trilocularis TaxID=1813537 RepID=A0ABQ7KMC3_BRACM|nr:hypothetical protein IGI04_039261 [Brassica rapa subsp. trilocularis]
MTSSNNKISVRLLKHLTSRRMILLLERPDSGKSTLLLALADKSLKLTESAQPKPTELFWVSSVRPTTCLGEHQQTATCQEHNQRPFAGGSTCNALTLRLERDLGFYRSEPKIVLATSINPKIDGEQTAASSKVAHVQKIEPLTISEHEYVIAAQPQIIEFLCIPAQANRAFAEAIDVVRDKGVAMAVAVVVIVAVASAEDIDAANGARPNFFRGEESSLN